MGDRLKITPLTRIGALLEAYPELEEVLIAYSPAFKKLRNPVLRRTVAKIATVEKAASIAGADVREMVAELRRAAGQNRIDTDETLAASGDGDVDRWAPPPDWIDRKNVEFALDADALLEAGEVPAGRIARAARNLGGDQFIVVTSTFRPVPLMDALEKQGFRVYLSQVAPDRFETWVCRSTDGPVAG